MKCTYKILPQFSLILEQFEGAISIDDSIEMTNRLIIDSQYSSLYNILVDLREFIPVQKAQHHIQDIDIFLNFFNGNRTLPNSTMAFIISEPIHAIITELFKEKVSESSLHIATFTTVQAAASFLQLTEYTSILLSELEEL